MSFGKWGKSWTVQCVIVGGTAAVAILIWMTLPSVRKPSPDTSVSYGRHFKAMPPDPGTLGFGPEGQDRGSPLRGEAIDNSAASGFPGLSSDRPRGGKTDASGSAEAARASAKQLGSRIPSSAHSDLSSVPEGKYTGFSYPSGGGAGSGAGGIKSNRFLGTGSRRPGVASKKLAGKMGVSDKSGSGTPGFDAGQKSQDAKAGAGSASAGQAGGASLGGSGITRNKKPDGPGPSAAAGVSVSQGPLVIVLPAENEIERTMACYGNLSKKLKTVKKGSDSNLQPKGRLICWVTSGGKYVFQYEDGSFVDATWYRQAKLAFRGAALMYQDKYEGDATQQQVIGYKTRVLSYFKKTGTYVIDGGGGARIPDSVAWYIYFTGGYKMTFTHGNSRDCIYSGNGIYTFSGPGHSINIPAQGCGAYRGLKTCIRCRINCRW